MALVIRINVKSLGSKRPKVAEAEFYLEKSPSNVRELIEEAVHTCVKEYNIRVSAGETPSSPLSDEKIGDMAEIGKIAFGINYGGKAADENEAIETAIQAYEDGLVRIFIGDNETGDISEKIDISEGCSVTFIKLAMLAGRMW